MLGAARATSLVPVAAACSPLRVGSGVEGGGGVMDGAFGVVGEVEGCGVSVVGGGVGAGVGCGTAGDGQTGAGGQTGTERRNNPCPQVAGTASTTQSKLKSIARVDAGEFKRARMFSSLREGKDDSIHGGPAVSPLPVQTP